VVFLRNFRIASYVAIAIIFLSIGVGLDHYFLSREYVKITDSANQYYEAVQLLNGFGTNFLPQEFRFQVRDDTAKPMVMGIIGSETCLNCLKTNMPVLKNLLSNGKISMVLMLIGYRGETEHAKALMMLKDFPWVFSYPLPDSLLRSNLGIGQDKPYLFSPIYMIAGRENRRAFFLPVGIDSVEFSRLLIRGLKNLK